MIWYLDDATTGEKTRKRTKGRRLGEASTYMAEASTYMAPPQKISLTVRNSASVELFRRATVNRVKLWRWQAPRVEAQCREVHVGRVDIGAVKEAILVLIGERVASVLKL